MQVIASATSDIKSRLIHFLQTSYTHGAKEKKRTNTTSCINNPLKAVTVLAGIATSHQETSFGGTMLSANVSEQLSEQFQKK